MQRGLIGTARGLTSEDRCPCSIPLLGSALGGCDVADQRGRGVAGLNKKILCFVDETGTAGNPDFALGCVMVWSRECGRADKAFSDLLPDTANEVHASRQSPEYLQSLLRRYARTDAAKGLLMINKLGVGHAGTPPEIYGRAVVDTVKTAVGRFGKLHALRDIGNVEVILDASGQNTDPACCALMEVARRTDGRFRAVKRIVQLDSAASRMLQVADVVAHARRWVSSGAENAKGLKRSYGIILP